MKKIQDNDADIMALDTGQAYFGGRYYNMMPILAENYSLVTDDTGKLQKILILLNLLLQWNELSLMKIFFFFFLLDPDVGMRYYSVAVAKRGSQFNVFQLQDKRACFPGTNICFF